MSSVNEKSRALPTASDIAKSGLVNSGLHKIKSGCRSPKLPRLRCRALPCLHKMLLVHTYRVVVELVRSMYGVVEKIDRKMPRYVLWLSERRQYAPKPLVR